MSVLANLGKGILGAFTGSGGGDSIVKQGADVVEKWFPGHAKRAEIEADVDKRLEEAVNNARTHDAQIGNVRGWFNDVVNGINRLVRPFVTVGLVGGVMGWWELPSTGTIDPVILGYTELVLIFWFGGRALFKDLPALIKYTRSIKTSE